MVKERKEEASVPVAAIAVTVCLAVAITNLGGWLGGIPLFISIVPGLPAMVPATAVLSLLTAAGLWVVRRAAATPATPASPANPSMPAHDVRQARPASRVRPATSALVLALPCVVVFLALAIEACYLAGRAPAPFLLVQSGHERITSLSSPVTAAIFCALGVALLLTAGRRHVKVAQGIALAVFLLAILNLAGYLFRDSLLFRFLPGRGTSVLTSTQAILLSLGVLFALPRRGLMAAVTGELPSARMSRRLLLAASIAPIATGALVLAGAETGLFDTGTALPLFVWCLVVLLVLAIWRFALQLAAVEVARLQAERELQAALGELRAEHDRKDVFLASLAHELRNPLAPIGTAAEVLRRGGAGQPEERQRIGNVIATQVRQIVELVNDLMDVERVRSGRIALDRAVFDLRDAVRQALDQTLGLIERRGHACSPQLPAEPVQVCGDRQRLVQVMANLLTNAAKYTPTGGTIRLCLAIDEEHVDVAVEDNGVGVDEALLLRLFEPYAQASVTSERTEGGLGLGLWLARRLAELHGGTITATSPGTGQGSTFTLRLPLAIAGAECRADS